MARELRCPKCQRAASPQSLTYSKILDAFVCPACAAGAAAARARGEIQPPSPRSTRTTKIPPPPSLIDRPPEDSSQEPPSVEDFLPTPQPQATDDSTSAAPALPYRWSPTAIVVGVLVLAIALTAVIVAVSRHHTPTLDEQQRAWDESHHDQVVALKSQAEALAIDGKLAEAHARYREIEKLIGGRQVKDPTLFDIVEVARADQDRIYKIMLAQMEKAAGTRPAVEEPGEKLAQAAAQAPARVTFPAPPAAAPGTGAPAAATSAPAAPPAASAPASLTVAAPVPVAATTQAATRASDADEQPATTQTAESIGVPPPKLTDDQITQSIQHGVEYLLSQFRDGEIQLNEVTNDVQRQGIDALCVYALATSGKAISDRRLGAKSPEMIQMLEKLKEYKLDPRGATQMPVTYARSLRACALAAFNRPQDREVLQEDVDWLVHAADHGAYTYDDRYVKTPFVPRKRPPTTRGSSMRASADADVYGAMGGRVIQTDGTFSPRPPAPPMIVPPRIFSNTLPQRPSRAGERLGERNPWDNSNSQYGLLGVWAGAEVGIEVAKGDNYWRSVESHWTTCQLPSGEWNYIGMDDGPRYSMSCAGIASLLVTYDYLVAPLLNGVARDGREPYPQALSAGLAWLEDGDNSVALLREPLVYIGYNLFGLERVGLASGFKHFGRHNWFVELATAALTRQDQDGSFKFDDRGIQGYESSRDLVNTAYVMLVLSRGRNPILMNKLRFDGYWSNRPREIANLTNYTSRELERPINWQVVDITRESYDWADSPILFIASNKPIAFKQEDLAKLSDFVDNGGIIFTHADLAAPEFNKFAADLSKQLFPAYPLQDLPADHELFKLNYNIPLPHPKIQAVSNGSRLLMVHCASDLSAGWQQRSTVSKKEAFQFGANLYLYATGKERFRNRLDTPIIPPPEGEPLRTIAVARLKYAGNWDPEPGAWPRMARKMQWETGAKLDIRPLEITDLSNAQCHVAHLTGTGAFSPAPEQLAALKAFLEAGGTLLVDAAGGSGAFATAAESDWIPRLLGDAKLQPIDPKDELLHHTIDGTVEAPEKALRLFALEQLHTDGGRLKSAKLGKGRVLFSALDVTSGLLGTNTWGIAGYLPEYSEAIVRNLILVASQ